MAESKGIDWSLRLAEVIKASSDIPTNITFKIEDIGKEKDVKAHKLVMGMASEAFGKMLYVHDKEAKEIVVKETTVAAFTAMVDAIYNTKTIHESLKDKTVHEMFAVLNLVKKYQIPELVVTARDCLATFPLREEAVLEVAGDAIQYLDTFDEEAKELLLHCAKFLQPKFKDAKSVFVFVAANKKHGDTMVELFALMEGIKPEQCHNCSQVPCKDGQEVKEEEIRVGLKVACNNSSMYWASNWGARGSYIGNRGTVDSIMGGNVKLKDCKTGGGQLNLTPWDQFAVKWSGSLSFCFYCETV